MKSQSLVLLHLNNYEIGKNQDVTNDADWEASKLASLNPTPPHSESHKMSAQS